MIFWRPPNILGVEDVSDLVRGVDDELARAHEKRARADGRSAEAEHRAILAAGLARPRRRSFADVLASMNAVSADADFERADSALRPHGVFD
jgi:antitoxin FitA